MRRLLLSVFLLGLGCARSRPPVVFLSDFGTKDSAVAVCKGVMWKVEPSLRIVDLTHEVDPYDFAAAGRLLDQTVPFYPPGAVFVAVVDPGVGSARRSVAAKTKAGHFLVGPDNGMFARILEREGLEAAVELKESRYFRGGELSSTFHGRDVFAPVGAHLAAGVRLEALGPRLESLTPLPERPAALKDGVVSGEVRYVEDPYGNVVTNIPRELMEKAGLRPGMKIVVTLDGKRIPMPFGKTFSDVREGSPVAVYHSRSALSFSINLGDFSKAHGVKARQTVLVAAD